MRHRVAGGENLYSADSEIEHNEAQLAVFAYMLGYDPEDVDSIVIAEVVSSLRSMWKYSSDIRSAGLPMYSANAIPRFFSKMNATLTDRVRKANWNYMLAKAVKNGQ
jgi:hypothetical protein